MHKNGFKQILLNENVSKNGNETETQIKGET